MYKKGPFSGGCRPTTWIELNLSPNKVAGVVYIYPVSYTHLTLPTKRIV